MREHRSLTGWRLFLAIASVGICVPAPAYLQITPLAEQDPEQRHKDSFECHVLTVERTGFDPTAVQTLPQDQPPPHQSTVVGTGADGAWVVDAAVGAGLGALGGAIAGDAALGAGIGAVVGVVVGGVRSEIGEEDERARLLQQQRRAQIEAERRLNKDAPRYAAYERAFGDCMALRDYDVKELKRARAD